MQNRSSVLLGSQIAARGKESLTVSLVKFPVFVGWISLISLLVAVGIDQWLVSVPNILRLLSLVVLGTAFLSVVFGMASEVTDD